MPEVQVWEYLTKRSYLYASSPSDNKSASLVSGSDDEFGQIHSSAQIVQHRHLEHAQSDSRDVHSKSWQVMFLSLMLYSLNGFFSSNNSFFFIFYSANITKRPTLATVVQHNWYGNQIRYRLKHDIITITNDCCPTSVTLLLVSATAGRISDTIVNKQPMMWHVINIKGSL